MELALQTELEGSLMPWAEFVHFGFGPVAVLWCEHTVSGGLQEAERKVTAHRRMCDRVWLCQGFDLNTGTGLYLLSQ